MDTSKDQKKRPWQISRCSPRSFANPRYGVKHPISMPWYKQCYWRRHSLISEAPMKEKNRANVPMCDFCLVWHLLPPCKHIFRFFVIIYILVAIVRVLSRLRVVSNFGDGYCEAGEIHKRARNFEETRREGHACACISPAPQSPSPKLETTRSLGSFVWTSPPPRPLCELKATAFFFLVPQSARKRITTMRNTRSNGK